MAKLIVLLALIAYTSAQSQPASKVILNIYNECLSQYSIACVKPRALEWISRVSNDDEIKITEDLKIVRTGIVEDDETVDPRLAKDPAYDVIDKVDRFIETHALRVKVPAEITNTAASEYVPRSLLVDLPSELNMPLSDDDDEAFEGRRKKIKLPKLKIKSSTLSKCLNIL